MSDTPMSCSVDIGRDVYAAEAHVGGGMGSAACSGDLLSGALAACAQITCQMVASTINIPAQKIEAVAQGDLDLAETLGISKETPVGFETIRLILKIHAPEATAGQIDARREKTEQYCVVMQPLIQSPNLETEWVRQETGDATG